MTTQRTSPAGTGLTSSACGGFRHASYSTRQAGVSTGDGRPVYFNGGLCGFVRGDTFCRRFDTRKHVLRNRQAIALHADVMSQIAGCVDVCLTDEANTDYWLTIGEIQRYGYPMRDPRFGDQTVIPLRYWRPTREIPTEVDEEPTWEQGTLL